MTGENEMGWELKPQEYNHKPDLSDTLSEEEINEIASMKTTGCDYGILDYIHSY